MIHGINHRIIHAIIFMHQTQLNSVAIDLFMAFGRAFQLYCFGSDTVFSTRCFEDQLITTTGNVLRLELLT